MARANLSRGTLFLRSPSPHFQFSPMKPTFRNSIFLLWLEEGGEESGKKEEGAIVGGLRREMCKYRGVTMEEETKYG